MASGGTELARADALLKPTRKAAADWAKDVFIPFPSLRRYRTRWLPRDLLAGVTFGAITIPGQLATAHLAGMPPTTGLYGFLVACIVGALISSNRHLAFGVDSTVAPLLAAGIGAVAVTGSPRYIAYATAATLLVGIIIAIIGFAELGWVGDLLPKPVITGFLAGIAITIIINQLPGLLGLPSQTGMDLRRLLKILGALPQSSIDTTIIGLAALAALLFLPKLMPRFPVALLVLVVATVVSIALDLPARGVAVLGELPSGLPPLKMPPLDLETARIVLPTSIGIAIICMAQTAATSRTVAAVGGFEANVARDFRALGVGNIASSVVGSFTIDASPPSSTILSEARGRTQVAALTAALLTAVLIVAAAGLIKNLPMSVLSAILIYIGAKIFRVDQMKDMYRYSWRAFGLMLGTMLGVILLGIELGLAIAVLAAFVYRGRQIARPEMLKLGRTPDGMWLPELDSRSEAPPGVGAYRLNGPLWFGNADWFRQKLIAAIGEGPAKVRFLILDATRIDDIDFTGVDALKAVMQVCELRDVTFAIAVHVGRTEQALRRGRVEKEIGKKRIFDTVEAAVQALQDEDQKQDTS